MTAGRNDGSWRGYDADAVVVFAGLTGLVGLIVHAVLAVKLGPGYAIPTTIVAAAAGAAVLRGALGQALAKRIQGDSGTDLPPEQLLNELDELRGRVAELEERADFSERLLAQQRDGQAGG